MPRHGVHAAVACAFCRAEEGSGNHSDKLAKLLESMEASPVPVTTRKTRRSSYTIGYAHPQADPSQLLQGVCVCVCESKHADVIM